MAEAGIDDGRDLLGTMGWESLPYGCLGLARRAANDRHQVWSWLILVPWAVNDSKPWIDGTHMVMDPMLSEDAQRQRVLAEMRDILDKRYGEAVAGRVADEFLRRLRDEE